MSLRTPSVLRVLPVSPRHQRYCGVPLGAATSLRGGQSGVGASVRKVPHTHRYHLTQADRIAVTALITMRGVSTLQLMKPAADRIHRGLTASDPSPASARLRMRRHRRRKRGAPLLPTLSAKGIPMECCSASGTAIRSQDNRSRILPGRSAATIYKLCRDRHKLPRDKSIV